jgi:hypothetical protein
MNIKHTKVIVVGSSVETKPVKSIEFVNTLSNVNPNLDSSVLKNTDLSPCDFCYIELICRKYQFGYDLMFAYDNPEHRGDGVLFIGHFNDGVV